MEGRPLRARRKCVLPPQTTKCPLKFLVVGGSLSGFASAYALARAGHDVTVLEAGDGVSTSHGSLGSPPNATRILQDWGLEDHLKADGITSAGLCFRDGHTSELVGRLKFAERLMRDFGASFHHIRHCEIHAKLRLRALQNGVTLRTHCKVISVNPEAPSVQLETGETVHADLIVGADGCDSLVRDIVGGDRVQSRKAPYAWFSLEAPLDAVTSDPDLAHLAQVTEWTCWMAPGCAMQGAPFPNKNIFTLLISMPYDGPIPLEENWSHTYDIRQCGMDLSGFGPRVQKLVGLAATVKPTLALGREPLDAFVHEDGKVLLVGDAAHPSMICGVHAFAACLEDAVTLGHLFSRLRYRRQITTLLEAYEDIRQPRCAALAESDKLGLGFLMFPPGPYQEGRDRGLRAALAANVDDYDDAEEHVLNLTWGKYIEPFGFDADDAFADWWTKFGTVLEGRMSQSVGVLELPVAETTERMH